jgi:hypothetical protein
MRFSNSNVATKLLRGEVIASTLEQEMKSDKISLALFYAFSIVVIVAAAIASLRDASPFNLY